MNEGLKQCFENFYTIAETKTYLKETLKLDEGEVDRVVGELYTKILRFSRRDNDAANITDIAMGTSFLTHSAKCAKERKQEREQEAKEREQEREQAEELRRCSELSLGSKSQPPSPKKQEREEREEEAKENEQEREEEREYVDVEELRRSIELSLEIKSQPSSPERIV